MDIFVGTAGFSYKDWEGIVYPPDLKKRKIHPLEYFAQFYDCCEINTSFYGPLRPETGKEWCAKEWCALVKEASPRFLFSAKLYRVFTHSPIAVVEPTSAATLQATPEMSGSRAKDWTHSHRKTNWERCSRSFPSRLRTPPRTANTCAS
jgi:uncharacterized protein YecE (DUF72 family)